MQKIKFGTGVMFDEKHGQVTSSVPKMLVGKYATQSIYFDTKHHRLKVGLRVVNSSSFIETLFNPLLAITISPCNVENFFQLSKGSIDGFPSC